MSDDLAKAKSLIADAMKLTAGQIGVTEGSEVRGCIVAATSNLSSAIQALDAIPRSTVYQRELDELAAKGVLPLTNQQTARSTTATAAVG